MKKIIYILAFVKTLVCFSQNDGGSPNAVNFISASEINSKIKLPKSPEADAFEKYGNTPVNLYTGTPEISIPLHTLKGRELEIPITLSYDASGIKVSQIATTAGLGWNLTFGGRISRISNGVPDDLPHGASSPNSQDIILNRIQGCITPYSEGDLLQCLDEVLIPITQGEIDTLLDYYSINVNGINDYIVQDIETLGYRTLINPKIQVAHIAPYNWIVTSEDGTEYYFEGVIESTEVGGGLDIPGGGHIYSGVSTSSWLLTKIISKNRLDVFQFTYKGYHWSNYFSYPLTSVTYKESAFCPIGNFPAGASYDMNKSFKTNQQVPYKIIYNNETLVEFDYKERLDLNFSANPIPYKGGNALNEILFYNYKTNVNSPTFFKKVKFHHTYFGNMNNAGNSNATIYNKRLKLDKLTFYNNDIAEAKDYLFEYDRPEQVPSINSYSQDFIGLYNAKYNLSLVPGIDLNNGLVDTAADRSSVFDKMTIGTLTKITYPTKGYSIFEYEQNSIPNLIEIPETTNVNIIDLMHDSCSNDYEVKYDNEIYWTYTYGVHSNMIPIYPSTYPNSTAQYSNPMYHSGRSISLLRIDNPKEIFIETSGQGLFMISKLNSPCDYLNDQVFTWESYFNNYQSTFNPCLTATDYVFYKYNNGSLIAGPDSFVTGGLLNVDNSQNAINLLPGNYQVTLWSMIDDSFPPNPFAEIRIYEKEYITVPAYTQYNVKKIEGFRIKSITDYSNNLTVASKKEYRYTKNLENDHSSGIQLGFKPEPRFYTTKYVACSGGSTSQGACRNLISVTMTSQGISASPNIGYESVFEIVKSGEEVNGFTQSIFNVGTTGLKYDSNGIVSFESNYQNGKIAEKIILNNKKDIKAKEKFSYDENEFFESSSYTYQKNSIVTYARAGQNGNFALNFQVGDCLDFSYPHPAEPPLTWHQGEGWYSNDLGKYSYHLAQQSIKGKFGFLSKKETFNYPPTGGELKQIEEYIYGNAESDYPYQLVEKKITGTNDIVKSEQYQYHPNYVTNPEKITDIKYFNDGEQIFHKNMVYSDYGTTANGLANLVSEIKTAKGTNSLESRLLFDYDSTTKNILNTVVPFATTLSNDNYDSYIFGYNDMYPVAKLSGVKYSQISTARLNTIKSLTNTIITPSSELALQNELNLLRSDFPNAQITTYTYDPVIGVKSITDPKGDVQYFFYDELNRLKEVKDKNGNKLSENQYHYRPQN